MFMKAAITAVVVAVATAAGAATTPAVFQTDLDDLADGTSVIDINSGVTSDVFNNFGFTDELFGGSTDYFVTVSFETLGSPTVFDDVSFGVGTAKDDYSIAGGPLSLADLPFSFLQTFTVNAGESLFINFALNNIKGGGYDYSVTATPVPLPAAAWMLIAGIGGLAAVARRKARAAA